MARDPVCRATAGRAAVCRTGSADAVPRLDEFFENAAVPMHLVDADGIIIGANRAELDLLGYSVDEYIGRPR